MKGTSIANKLCLSNCGKSFCCIAIWVPSGVSSFVVINFEANPHRNIPNSRYKHKDRSNRSTSSHTVISEVCVRFYGGNKQHHCSNETKNWRTRGTAHGEGNHTPNCPILGAYAKLTENACQTAHGDDWDADHNGTCESDLTLRKERLGEDPTENEADRVRHQPAAATAEATLCASHSV